MPRVDDYINARQLAVERLSRETFGEIAERTGFETKEETLFRIPFLGKSYVATYPEFDFRWEAGKEMASQDVPIQEQVLILHYMLAPSSVPLQGRWVAYREIPGASFYFSAFAKRAIDPLVKVFGGNLSGFEAASIKLGGHALPEGDLGFEFFVFPRIPLRLVIWEGDEDFAPSGNILFDESVGRLVSAEDAAWLAGMLVYRLAALARQGPS